MFKIQISGSFFNDVGWDEDVRTLDKTFKSIKEANHYIDDIIDGIIEIEEWNPFQDPDNSIYIVEVKNV